MPLIDDIRAAIRDFTRYTGDGLPNAPVGAPLPAGDPQSGIHNISKADLRNILIAILQAQGDPDALDDIISGLNGKADLANSGKVFASRAAAVSAGQSALPGSLGLIFTVEGVNNETLAVRSFSNAGDDPLFATQPRWGVAMRVPNVLALNGKADLANSGKVFASRAAAVSAGQSALPGSLGLIFTVEGVNNETLAVRSFSNAGDDPLFATQPRWGVAMRVPNVLALNGKADRQQISPRRNYTSNALFLAATTNGDIGYVNFAQVRNNNGAIETMPLDAISDISPWTIVAGARGVVIDEYSKNILIPQFQVMRGRLGSVETVTPTSGLYFEVEAGDLPPQAEIARLAYYDAGSGNAPVLLNFPSQSDLAFRENRIILAVSRGGAISSPMGLAQVVPNVVQKGAASRQLIENSSYMRGITDATLTGIGVTEIASSPDGNPQAAARIPDENTSRNGHMFVRCFVILGAGEAANSFPALVRAHTIKRAITPSSGVAMPFGSQMILEKVYGPRIASYVSSLTRLVSSSDIGAVRVGVYSEATARDISISLPQVGFGSQPSLFVQPNDWPASVAGSKGEPFLYYPQTVSKFDSRPLPFYVHGVVGARFPTLSSMPVLSVMCENSGAGNNGAARAPFGAASRDMVKVGSGELADALPVRLSITEDAPSASRRVFVYAQSRVVSDISTAAYRLAFIGDSITDVYPTVARTGGVLLDAGAASVGYVGTLNADNQAREGRSGRKLAQYINRDTTLLPVGDAAAYMAMTDAQKKTYNPLIRAATVGELGAYNGHVFDYANYLSRFSLATPTHVVIHLGTNDIADYDDPEALKAAMVDGIGIMVRSILAVNPSIRVVLTAGGDQWQAGAERRRIGRYDGVIRGILAASIAAASPRVSVAPAWAHMNGLDFADALNDGQRTDPDTGAIVRAVGSDVHFTGAPLREFCECVAATIAGNSTN